VLSFYFHIIIKCILISILSKIVLFYLLHMFILNEDIMEDFCTFSTQDLVEAKIKIINYTL